MSKGTRLLAKPLSIVAHRGDSKAAPENTMPAFRSALQYPIDAVELDFHQAADNTLVVFHDTVLDRTTNAYERWHVKDDPVHQHTWNELAELDAGAWFSPQFAGTPIPKLADALDELIPKTTVVIERKSGDPQTVVDLLHKNNWTLDVVLIAFDWEFLAGVRALDPKICLGALGKKSITPEVAAKIKPLGVQAVDWNCRDVERQSVAICREQGWPVMVYTVDKVDLADQLVEMGVTSLTTNYPRLLCEHFGRG